jgi:O-antigen/teichoic acid export membrane protein
MYKTISLSIIFFALSVQSAFAYIDPGSGSAIMSIIIGIFVSIGVIIKTFWYKIKSLLGLSKSDKTTEKDNLK